MNKSTSTYAITPVELKGVRCKISKIAQVKSRRLPGLFSWKKSVGAPKVDSGNGEDELCPDMRVVLWCQKDESFDVDVEECVLSCPLKVVSEEDNWMIMNCNWPEGTVLRVPGVSRDNNLGQTTLGLGIQLQNNAILSIGTAEVSFFDGGSTPVKQSDQVLDKKYHFDVSSSTLATVLDMIDKNVTSFVADEHMQSSSPSAKESNMESIPGPTSSAYVEDDWKLWDTDDSSNAKANDFFFVPMACEDTNAVEQKKQFEWVESDKFDAATVTTANTSSSEAGSYDLSSLLDVSEEEMNAYNSKNKPIDVKSKSKFNDCFDDTQSKGTHSNASVDAASYSSSSFVIEYQDEAGEINQVEFTNEDVHKLNKNSGKLPKKLADIILDLDSLLTFKARDKSLKDKDVSMCTVVTASTSCSSSSSDITPEEKYRCTEDFGPGCGSTLAELVDILSTRNCVQKNFELCLEEFFDAADDASFASEPDCSVYQDIPTEEIVEEQFALIEEIELLKSPIEKKKKKKRFANSLRCVEL